MNENLQPGKKKETAIKGTTSLRVVLNIFGMLTFSALALSIFTHPVTENVEGFLFFIPISSVVYFSLLNLYYLGGIWRKVVFISLCFIALLSIISAIYTLVFD